MNDENGVELKIEVTNPAWKIPCTRMLSNAIEHCVWVRFDVLNAGIWMETVSSLLVIPSVNLTKVKRKNINAYFKGDACQMMTKHKAVSAAVNTRNSS